MIRQDAYFQIIEEKAPETLPPRPIEEPANPVSGLLITSAAIPSIASLGTVVWVGASIASWLFAGASWLCLAIVLLARQRHVAHWKLQRHLYDLKSGMYTYYVISQGVPRAEPD